MAKVESLQSALSKSKSRQSGDGSTLVSANSAQSPFSKNPKTTKTVNAVRSLQSTQSRDTWKNHITYILTSIGYTVGFGNIWRYPYLAYQNGGAAFVIPYICSVILFGLPFYAMEAFLGQLSGIGVGQAHGYLAPLFQGVGWGMVSMSYTISLYYNVLISWCLFYLGASLTNKLPYSDCDNEWNTIACQSFLNTQNCRDQLNVSEPIYFDGNCYGSRLDMNHSVNETFEATTKISSTEEYFTHFVLMKSAEYNGISSLSWKLALALLGAWLLVFITKAKGVTVSGKIIYFTAVFPYVMLIILLIRGCLLPGSGRGIQFYVKPNIEKLKDFTVWKDAAVQVFFSLGPSMGGLVTMASYNPFHTNLERDAIIVACMDSLTSLLAGCAIFASLGYLAFTMKKDVHEVVESGLMLVFVAYPETLQRLFLAPMWSVMFFFMLITLGLGSQFVIFETTATAIEDMFPKLQTGKNRVIFVGCFCLFSYLFSLVFCTDAGIYLFIIFDDYSIGYCSIIVAFGEAMLIAFVYGVDRFIDDIYLILGKKLNIYWRFMWLVATPIYSLSLFFVLIYYYAPSRFGNYIIPHTMQRMGWLISSSSVISIVGFAIYHIVKNRRSGKPSIDLVMPIELYNPKKRSEESSNQKQRKMLQNKSKIKNPHNLNEFFVY